MLGIWLMILLLSRFEERRQCLWMQSETHWYWTQTHRSVTLDMGAS